MSENRDTNQDSSAEAVGPLPEQSTAMVVVETAEIPTAVVKFTNWAMARMEEAFDTTFSELPAALAHRNLAPAGPAFSLHHRMPDDTADFEVGLPLSAPLETAIETPEGLRIEPSWLPGGRAAALSALGGYDRLPEAWAGLLEAVAAAGAEPELPFWEVYVTEPSPEADPESMRTDLFTRLG